MFKLMLEEQKKANEEQKKAHENLREEVRKLNDNRRVEIEEIGRGKITNNRQPTTTNPTDVTTSTFQLHFNNSTTTTLWIAPRTCDNGATTRTAGATTGTARAATTTTSTSNTT